MQLDAFYKITYQIIILGLLGLTGFISGRTGYLPENSGKILSRIVVSLTAPILIFTTLINRPFSSKIISDGLKIYVLAIVFMTLSFCLTKIITIKLRLNDSTRNIFVMYSMFGNVMFLAFPLIRVLYGEEGIAYALFFNLANDTLLWTLGIFLVNRHNTKNWKNNLKHLINGNTIAFTAGIILAAVGLQNYISQHAYMAKVYNLLYTTFHPLGESTIYLSMLFVGLILSEVRIEKYSDIAKRYPIFILSFIKLILIPILAIFILTLFGRFIDQFSREIIVLQLAMPCGTIVAALALQYGSDYKFATESVSFSTILSIITLPFVLLILKLFA